MHYLSRLFDKLLYMFRTGPLSIFRSISTLCTHNSYLSCQFCWHLLAWSGWNASRRQQNQHDKYLLRVYSVEVLLMMDSGHVRNMQSTLSNKFEKQCISLAFIIRIHHDTRSSEWQMSLNNTSQQDFGTRKVYCDSNVTFHAESKNAIKIFPSPTVFVQWPF